MRAEGLAFGLGSIAKMEQELELMRRLCFPQ